MDEGQRTSERRREEREKREWRTASLQARNAEWEAHPRHMRGAWSREEHK